MNISIIDELGKVISPIHIMFDNIFADNIIDMSKLNYLSY